MSVVLVSFATLVTLLCVGLTYFIFSMVQLVGMGEDFWSVWVVQLDIVLGVTSILSWVWVIIKTKKRRHKNPYA